MKFRSLLLFTLFSSITFLPLSYAAQDSTIVGDNAPIHIEPRRDSEVIEYLPVGVEVRISNYPVPGGWYKIRSKTGIYGWINETFLSVAKGVEKMKPKYALIEGPRPERDRKWVVRGMFGFDFFKPDDLNAIFQFDELNTGNVFGAEVGYSFSNDWTLSLRFEALTKDVVAKESLTQGTYNLAIRSYPVMAGIDYFLTKLPAMRLTLGAFIGLGLSTSFSSEAINQNSPNLVVLQSNALTYYVRANLTRPLGRIVSVFGELGYRFLNTDKLNTVNIANGGSVFIRDNVYKSRELNLSGPVVVLGLGVHL